MLDDSQDPTPLLKEIRDDKTATIIVDANATMSHIILERVRCHVRASCDAPTPRRPGAVNVAFNDFFLSFYSIIICVTLGLSAIHTDRS